MAAMWRPWRPALTRNTPMQNEADAIPRSFQMNMAYCRALLADVPASEMGAQPVAGLNHAAWIAGHLAYSFQAIGTELGLRPWLPDHWASLFGTGSRALPDARMYPAKAMLTDVLEDSAGRLVDRLRSAEDSELARPLPDERYRDVFPTLGAAVLHILVAHAAVHIGQLSAWRRAMRLRPVPDPL